MNNNNKNNTKINEGINMLNLSIDPVPLFTYNNADLDKFIAYVQNKDKCGVYRWNNLITGKSYIGSSISLDKRLSNYSSLNYLKNKVDKGSSAIYNALLKYGHSNFSLDIFDHCEPSILIEKEQYFIDLLKPEYNILKIAGNKLGSKHSEKTKALMSSSRTGINHPFYGKMHSLETIKKIGLTLKSLTRVNNKPKILDLETRLKLSLRSHGVPVKVFDGVNTLIGEFMSIKDVAKYFNISSRTVGRYLDKEISYNGFTFKSCLKDK